MSLHEDMLQKGRRARKAAYQLALLSTTQKNAILNSMADVLIGHSRAIQTANAEDVQAAEAAHLSAALLDRLRLDEQRITAMADGLRTLSQLSDPVGEVLSEYKKDNGLIIRKVRVPIGVIGIIYESRPNVTADVAGLCIKTANAIILRGGSESINSNRAIYKALSIGANQAGAPEHAIQLVNVTDREAIKELVQLQGYVDLVIPRGGEGLINAVTEMARVPIIKHYHGICQIYVDQAADLEMAVNISKNAKCQRPGVCNAVETLLVHQDVAEEFLPRLQQALTDVELRGDDKTRAILPDIKAATEKDWTTEYLDLILSIRVVPDLQAAIEHINHYGSHHSDAIISNAAQAQQGFLQQVDSAAVYVNASTRFTDGAEFGMGAEVGISTDKLHARGPMGLAELTTYKYLITGTGQVRE